MKKFFIFFVLIYAILNFKSLHPFPKKYNPENANQEDNNTVNWSNHKNKHVAPKNIPWKKIVSSTKKGPAKYAPDNNVEELERFTWENGAETKNNSSAKVFDFENIIGASKGEETSCCRVELDATDTIHGH